MRRLLPVLLYLVAVSASALSIPTPTNLRAEPILLNDPGDIIPLLWDSPETGWDGVRVEVIDEGVWRHMGGRLAFNDHSTQLRAYTTPNRNLSLRIRLYRGESAHPTLGPPSNVIQVVTPPNPGGELVIPSSVDFGCPPPFKTVRRTLYIRNRANTQAFVQYLLPLNSPFVNEEDPGIDTGGSGVSPTDEDDPGYAIDLEFRGTSLGPQRSHVRIYSTDPDHERVDVLLTANVDGKMKLTSLTADPHVVGGQPGRGRLTLSCGPTTGKAIVRLSSSKQQVLQVPHSVVVLAGTSIAFFPVATRQVSKPASVTLTARLGKVKKKMRVSVEPG